MNRWEIRWDMDFIQAVQRLGVIQQGDFTLSSGVKSIWYADMRRITLDPQGATLVGRWIARLADEMAVDAIAGPAMGAVPMITAGLISATHRSMRLSGHVIRKEPKDHGTQRMIEGPVLAKGLRVLLVDDVITSGDSLIHAAERVQDAGAYVTGIAALLDRQVGGYPRLTARGWRVHVRYALREDGKLKGHPSRIEA